LIKNVSETLAGRVEFIELSGFDLTETSPASWQTLWERGGYPRAYLADSDEASAAWREGFIRTFLERDIPQLGINIPATAMRRFWTMIAHYHGQVWNASEIARAMGVSDKTVRAYLDILTGTYMIRQLQPWFENLGKRQVKAPKIYFRDTGLLHSLLGLPDFYSLSGHPKVGASWEGFVVEQIGQILRPAEMYFWATHNGSVSRPPPISHPSANHRLARASIGGFTRPVGMVKSSQPSPLSPRRPPMPSNFENEYLDVLQNLELGIRIVHEEHPELTDYNVDSALEALMRTYKNEGRGKAPKLPGSPLTAHVYHSVQAMCDWRLGRVPLVDDENEQPVEVGVQPLMVEEILACLARIRKSIRLWKREGGRQGYLNYISQFLG